MEDERSLFSLLVLSLGNAALVGLGLVPDPEKNGSYVKNLEQVQHNIDMLSVLQKKTKGNLDAAEEEMLTSLLYDLRLKFVEASKKS